MWYNNIALGTNIWNNTNINVSFNVSQNAQGNTMSVRHCPIRPTAYGFLKPRNDIGHPDFQDSNTIIGLNPPNTQIGFDIGLNPRVIMARAIDEGWTNAQLQTFIRNVTIHELGHIALADNPQPSGPSIMNVTRCLTEIRTLNGPTARDIQNMNRIYPRR